MASIDLPERFLVFLFLEWCSVLGFMVFNSLVYEVTIPLLLLSEDKLFFKNNNNNNNDQFSWS